MAEENYSLGGGRSGSSERLVYASTSDSGATDSVAVMVSKVRPDTRTGDPQPAIETQRCRQSVVCLVGAFDDDLPQSASSVGCSTREFAPDDTATDTWAVSHAHVGTTAIDVRRATAATHAVKSRVMRSVI